MGRFPGETSCLTLVWAVLDLLITHQTNGINFNALDRQRLKRARYDGTEQTDPRGGDRRLNRSRRARARVDARGVSMQATGEGSDQAGGGPPT